MSLAQQHSEPADEVLAASAKRGDHEAFMRLAARHRRMCVGYSYAILGRADEAEDAAQEALIRAYRALGHLSGGRKWSSWLSQIVRNVCLDALRQRKMRPTDEVGADFPDRVAGPEAHAMCRERSGRLGGAVAALPEAYRVPVVLHYGYELTYAEIAERLDVPKSTIVGRIAGALRLLRRKVTKEDLL